MDDELDISEDLPYFSRLSYALFGNIAKKRKDSFKDLEDSLIQARIDESLEVYLSKVIMVTILGAVTATVLSGVSLGVLVVLGRVGTTLAVLLPLLVFLPLGLLASLGAVYYYPKIIAGGRASQIDKTMPYGITFMYALSRGGMNFVDVIREMANSQDSYGELAKEYKTLVNEMDYFGKDLMTALQNLSERTPSDKLAEFNQDLISVLQSGADPKRFLKDQSEKTLQESRRSQEQFLETLELVGEGYVTLFVAAPVFIIIILMTMMMIGNLGISIFYLIVYLILPIMVMVFFVFVTIITPTEDAGIGKIESRREKFDYETAKKEFGHVNDQLVNRLIEEKNKSFSERLIEQPKKVITETPLTTTIATIPLAILSTIALTAVGIIQPSPNAMIQNPVINSFGYIILPLLIVFTPISVIHEIKQRRKKKMLDRLPETLSKISGTNRIGMNLSESIKSVEDNTKGQLGEELKKIRNDINVNHDINAALQEFANRVQIPQISRSMKLVTKANQSTGDIGEVLDVAAKDNKQNNQLRKERSSSMTAYLTVIIVSFVIYAGIIVMLDTFFLTRIEEVARQAAQASQGAGRSGGVQISEIPIDQIRMILFHSLIVQAISTGTIAGYLKSNNVLSGLKITLTLLVLSTLVFALA